jgi:hypothetical protein
MAVFLIVLTRNCIAIYFFFIAFLSLRISVPPNPVTIEQIKDYSKTDLIKNCVKIVIE